MARGLNPNARTRAKLTELKDYCYYLVFLVIAGILSFENLFLRDYVLILLALAMCLVPIVKVIVDQLGKTIKSRLASDEEIISMFDPKGIFLAAVHNMSLSTQPSLVKKEIMLQFRNSWRAWLPTRIIKTLLGAMFILFGFTFIAVNLSIILGDLYMLANTDILSFLYATTQSFLLIGYDSICPLNSQARLLSLVEFVTGLLYAIPLINGVFFSYTYEKTRYEEAIDSCLK